MTTLQTLKRWTGLYLAILIITLLTYSCKKDQTSQNLDATDQQKLRDWYNANVSQSKQNPFNTLNPNWDNVQVKEVNGQIVYEISMNNPQKIFIGNANTDKDKAAETFSRNDTRFLIFENKQTGLLEKGCYMSISNSGTQNNVKFVEYKETADFTGTIIYFNPNGKMANGWAYRDGALLQRISVSNETEYKSMMRIRSEEARINLKNGGKLSYTQPAYCVPEYTLIYGTSCAGVDGYMNCTQYIIGREYTYNCEYGGGSGGEYTPPNPTGGGGTPTGTTPTKEITNKITDPCLKKTIDEALATNKDVTGLLRNLINRYSGTNNGVKLTLTDGNINTPARASTQLINNIVTINIDFKTGHFDDMSKEVVVATLLHEVVHSHLREVNPTYKTQSREQQHNVLFTFFVQDISDYLQSKYGMPAENAWGLAWFGVGDTLAALPSGTPFSVGDGNIMTKEEIGAAATPYLYVGEGSKGTPNCP